MRQSGRCRGGEGRITELQLAGLPLPSPGEGAWSGSVPSSRHLPSLALPFPPSPPLFSQCSSALSSQQGPFWHHWIQVLRRLWHLLGRWESKGEIPHLPMPVRPCLARKDRLFPHTKYSQVSHHPLLPCCDHAGVLAQLPGQPATSSGCKSSSPAPGPCCRERGGKRSCRLQHGCLVEQEEGAAEACMSPRLCKSPGCRDGWHRHQTKLLPAPLLYTLGAVIIPPPNSKEGMGLWSCCMASTSSGTRL